MKQKQRKERVTLKPYCKTCERFVLTNSTEFGDCLAEHDLTYMLYGVKRT
jgi:molybdenum cofactor biosynthesis enzyme MoaA